LNVNKDWHKRNRIAKESHNGSKNSLAFETSEEMLMQTIPDKLLEEIKRRKN
jgi:hypothetical protein